MNQAGNQSALFDYYGKPSFSQAFPLAMQHVVAAIVGCVTPAIIVSGAAGLNPTDKVFLIQAALVVAGLATLLQLFPIGNKNGLHIGAALPVIMGVSFAYVPSMQAIAGHESGLGLPQPPPAPWTVCRRTRNYCCVYHRSFLISHCRQLHGRRSRQAPGKRNR